MILIRKSGAPILGFGGVSSGPEPLKLMHENIRAILDALDGSRITLTAIVDIMNLIGQCVVAGNCAAKRANCLGPSLPVWNIKN